MKYRKMFSFRCNQFELAHMMITIGTVGMFDNMERVSEIKDAKENTIVYISDESHSFLLEQLLAALRISYTIECNFGVQ
ncbi:MAG: hypothetical protein EKK54_07990 [Neisseriaceae bacterium]|nr:MAG: hypothetical protein EKK54_07990 [Neisseriaceae bacterium]